jgi:hypothetical protein
MGKVNCNFKNVQIGDNVFSLNYNWGKVIEVEKESFDVYFDTHDYTEIFDFSGRIYGDDSPSTLYPVIFWDIPFNKIPKPPRRKSKITLEYYFQICKNKQTNSYLVKGPYVYENIAHGEKGFNLEKIMVQKISFQFEDYVEKE